MYMISDQLSTGVISCATRGLRTSYLTTYQERGRLSAGIGIAPYHTKAITVSYLARS